MTTNEHQPNSPRIRWLLSSMALLAVPLLILWWPGCRHYPAATSKESMSLMKLLYAACNTQEQARLAKVEQGVEKATREGKLSPPEQESFAKIIGTAKAGRWADAEKAAFQFAQDQVGVGHPNPNPADHKHDRAPRSPGQRRE